MNPCERLIRAAQRAPEKVALEGPASTLTYAAFADAALRGAAGLGRDGIVEHDAVGLMLPNGPLPVAVYGAWANGCVVVPMNVLLTPREVRHVVADSRLRAIVTSPLSVASVMTAIEGMQDPPAVYLAGGEEEPGQRPFRSLLAGAPAEMPVPRSSDEHVLTLYTSGTSGVPKGAMISAGNLAAQTAMLSDAFAVDADDRLLCTLPLFHAFGLNAILQTAVAHAGTIVLHNRFEIEPCVRSLATERITWFAGVPTMFAYLLQYGAAHPVAFPDLRVCVSGGAALPLSTMRAFEERFGVSIDEGYGMSETTVGVTGNRAGRRRPGTTGCAYDGVSIRIVDDDLGELPPGQCGQIVVRGPNVMLGYRGQAEATRAALQDGWLLTGDLGSLDEEGFLSIVGRKSELIIKGGYNIYPREVEGVLATCPGVTEAAVVGVADSVLGESVRAVVVVDARAGVSEERLRAHVAANLAKYKHPTEYRFVEALPRTPMGKVLKSQLAA